MKTKFKWRVFTSFMMFFSFAVEAITGIILYIVPPGRVANWTNWKLLGLSKAQWQSWHTLFGYLFIIIAILHIIYNWKSLIYYLKSKLKEKLKHKKEIYTTLVIVILFSVGSLFNIPPFSSVYDLGEKISESWETKESSPPIPHAEKLNVEELSKYIEKKPEEIFEILKKEGIVVSEKNKTFEEIAKDNNVSPSDLLDLINSKTKNNQETKRGYGRMSIKMIAVDLNTKPKTIIKILKNNDIESNPEDTLKEIADRYNKTPMEIFEIVKAGLKTER